MKGSKDIFNVLNYKITFDRKFYTHLKKNKIIFKKKLVFGLFLGTLGDGMKKNRIFDRKSSLT